MDGIFFRSCSNKAAVINVLLSAFSTLSSACRLLLGQKHLLSVYTAPAMIPIWFWSTVLLLTMKGNSFLALYLLLWSFLLCCSTVFLNNNQLFPYTMDNIGWQETWQLDTHTHTHITYIPPKKIQDCMRHNSFIFKPLHLYISFYNYDIV